MNSDVAPTDLYPWSYALFRTGKMGAPWDAHLQQVAYGTTPDKQRRARALNRAYVERCPRGFADEARHRSPAFGGSCSHVEARDEAASVVEGDARRLSRLSLVITQSCVARVVQIPRRRAARSAAPICLIWLMDRSTLRAPCTCPSLRSPVRPTARTRLASRRS